MSAAKIGIGLVVGLLVGGAAGGYVGSATTAKAVVGNAAVGDANGANECVEVLETLRAKKYDEGLAGLEEHLNQHLVLLTPADLEREGVDESAAPKINEARLKAKAYRTANPQKDATGLAKMVATMLDQAK